MMATISVKRARRCRGGGEMQGPSRTAWVAAVILAVLWLTPGCPAPPGSEGLKKEVEALKAEVASLKEKLGQMEASQKVLLEMVKGSQQPKAADLPAMMQAPPAQPSASPLTVDELFKAKDSLLGTRVIVKGVPGPVLMHKKTLFLSSPGGMIEVIYGNLQDKNQVDRLTAQTIETPITVSGVLSAAPGQEKKAVRLVIMADAVEF